MKQDKMKGDRHYILRWLSGILMLLLLTACSGSSSEGGNEPVPVPSNPVPTPDKPVLKIYIFPPNRPTITRADDLGNVNASEEENKIHSLHVWVFERNESNLDNSLLVGYVSMGHLTLETGNGEVTMEITQALSLTLPAKARLHLISLPAPTANAGTFLPEITEFRWQFQPIPRFLCAF